MKKTTVFFLTIGILAMIVGGIGGTVYFRRAEHSMVDVKKQTYEIKDKQSKKSIHLNLSGNAEFYILTENSNKVVMDSRSSLPVSIKSTLDVKEKNNQLLISANSNQRKKEFEGLKFDFFDRGSAVTLTIPDDTEQLIIDGKADGSIHLSNAETKDLAISFTNSDISVNDANAEKLSIKTTNGYLNVFNGVRADEATFQSTNGDIQVNDFTASKWSATSTSGAISLNEVKGIANLETINGDIQVTNLKGEVQAQSTNGSFSLYGTEIPKKLLVESQLGDIYLHTEEILYDVTIKAKTQLGDSTIFGKERTSYKRGKGTKSFTLQANSGDISVEGPSDYDDGEDE